MLKKLLDLVFYSNLFIALCAVALTWQTYLLLGFELPFNALMVLVFCCTLLIYALHRIVGLSKVDEFIGMERFSVISHYKSHIWFYAFLAIVGGTWSFFMVSRAVQLALVIPGIISLAYVLPVLGGSQKLRLRDVNMVKIFLVAGVWGYVSVILPALELGLIRDQRVWLMLLERMLFIFAITLPFDIRDLKVDRHNKVDTIPALLGLRRTLLLAFACLVVFCVLVMVNYGFGGAAPLLFSAVSTYFFIHLSSSQSHDYYFTGLMDGTMILQFLLVWGGWFFGWGGRGFW